MREPTTAELVAFMCRIQPALTKSRAEDLAGRPAVQSAVTASWRVRHSGPWQQQADLAKRLLAWRTTEEDAAQLFEMRAKARRAEGNAA